MRKKVKGLFATLVLAVLVTSSALVSFAQEQVVSYNDVGVQEDAHEAYENLMNSFPQQRSTGEKIYPDYYGGSYINDEGKLVVYVKDMVSEPTVRAAVNSGGAIYQECDYSYNELNAVMDKINAYKFENADSDIAKECNLFGLFDSENRVIVKLDNLTEENIDEFKKNVCDSDAIVFEQGNGPAEMDVSVDAGASLTTSSATASMGYRVKRNGVEGFVTAGHFTGANALVYYGGTNFAKCSVSQRSGKADAAFCAITNSNYALTNTLAGTSNVLSTTISEPGVGTVINKIGQTTGHTSGKVTSTNVTITFVSGDTIANLTAADYTSAAGDSGGVVYSYISSTNARLTLGIHTGSNSTTAYYTKANEVNAALGTSRY